MVFMIDTFHVRPWLLFGLWLRLRFRNAIDHGAIRCDHVLRGSGFDLRSGDVLKRRQQRVDLLRVVAE